MTRFIITVGMFLALAACSGLIYDRYSKDHVVVSTELIGHPFGVRVQEMCTGPGFCYATDPDGAYRYAFRPMCYGSRELLVGKQKYSSVLENGKVVTGFYNVSSFPTTECRV